MDEQYPDIVLFQSSSLLLASGTLIHHIKSTRVRIPRVISASSNWGERAPTFVDVNANLDLHLENMLFSCVCIILLLFIYFLSTAAR